MWSAIKKISSYAFGKTTNILRISAGLFLDHATIAINIIAPTLALNSVKINSDGNNNGNSSSTVEVDYAIIGTAAALLVVGQVLPKIRNFILSPVTIDVQKSLSLEMVKKSYALPFDHHVTTPDSEFQKAFSENYRTVQSVTTVALTEVIPPIIESAATSIFLTVKFGPAAVAPLIVSAAYITLAWWGEKRLVPYKKNNVNIAYREYGTVLRAVGNYELANQFGNAHYEIDKVNQGLDKTVEAFRTSAYHRDINIIGLSVLNAFGYIGTLTLFAIAPRSGVFKLNDFFLFSFLLMRLNSRWDSLPSSLSTLIGALTDFGKIEGFLDKNSPISDVPNAVSLETMSPLKIEFRSVNFAYPEPRPMQGAPQKEKPNANDKEDVKVDIPANKKQANYGSIGVTQNKQLQSAGGASNNKKESGVKDISFIVNAGAKVAIVGPTGCGKSTLIKLLLRFYRVDSGEILVNGININQYTAESLRRHFAIVSQSSVVFEGNIFQNIQYGDLLATREDVIKAAQFAELIEDDTHKLDKSTGHNGQTLSGGEKQRLAIARALLKGGQACLLDEATSALDPAIEVAVQATLDKVTAHATTLVISHQLHTVINADLILCMEDGKIIEAGTFPQLIASKGHFYTQFKIHCDSIGSKIEDIRPHPRPKQENSEVQAFWSRYLSRMEPLAEREMTKKEVKNKKTAIVGIPGPKLRGVDEKGKSEEEAARDSSRNEQGVVVSDYFALSSTPPSRTSQLAAPLLMSGGPYQSVAKHQHSAANSSLDRDDLFASAGSQIVPMAPNPANLTATLPPNHQPGVNI